VAMTQQKNGLTESGPEVLFQRLEELKHQINKMGPVMRGSVVVIGTRNKQPYFSVKINQKTRLIYLGRRREAQAKVYSENYRMLQQIVDEMTLINMQLLRLDGSK
jgi:hypothetical protein